VDFEAAPEATTFESAEHGYGRLQGMSIEVVLDEMNALRLWVASSDLLQRAHVGRPFAISAGERSVAAPRVVRRCRKCLRCGHSAVEPVLSNHGAYVRSKGGVYGCPLKSSDQWRAAVLGSLGCGNSHPGNDGGKNSPAPATNGGGGSPSPPALDDSDSCAKPILPAPDLDPHPVRPCTEQRWDGTTEFRYDVTGRILYRADHYTFGGPPTTDTIYASEDDANTRVETVTTNGALTLRKVTRMKNGVPLQADYFQVSAGGVEELSGHYTWTYDASGRPVSMVIDSGPGMAQMTETDSYDAQGRLYFVDRTQRSPPSDEVVARNWTLRSWHSNGQLAGELHGCGDPAAASTSHVSCELGGWQESRWDACGNPTYIASEPHNGGAWSVDWSWDGANPSGRHDRWGTRNEWKSTESYTLDSSGRVVSSSVVVTNPPELVGWSLPTATEEYRASYVYDTDGHVIQRTLDGKTAFEALFDSKGGVLMRHDDRGRYQWTYDGCGG